MKNKFIKAMNANKSNRSNSVGNVESEHENLFKMVIIGDSGVGKSCLLLKYADDTYTKAHLDSIGVEYKSKTLNVLDQNVKTTVWDTKEYDRNRNYGCVHAVIIAFDLTNQESFNHVKDWVGAVQRTCKESTPIILVGTKCDLDHKVSDEAIRNLLAEGQLISCYIETSAKDDKNIGCVFETASKKILKKTCPSIEKNNDDNRLIINKLTILCENYIAHLNKNMDHKSAPEKKIIVENLKEKLSLKNSSQSKAIEDFNGYLTENKHILQKHRDSNCTRFFAGVLHALSVGIFSKLTKGTFAFWKSHGESFCDEIQHEISAIAQMK